MAKRRIFFLLSLLFVLLISICLFAACSDGEAPSGGETPAPAGDSSPEAESSPTQPAVPAYEDAQPVGRDRLLADRPQGLVQFSVKNPFTGKEEVQEFPDVTLKNSRHKADREAKTDTVTCTIIAQNAYYRISAPLTYVYVYQEGEGWLLDSCQPDKPLCYEVLVNPLRDSAANARPGYEMSGSSYVNGEFLFYYRKPIQKPLCQLVDKLTVHAAFDGQTWSLTDEAGLDAEQWQLEGTWVLDHFNWDFFHIESRLNITNFDWAAQTISGSWHVKVSWFTTKLDDTVVFVDEPILVQGPSSFTIPRAFRYSAFFSDHDLELNVDENKLEISTSLHPLFSEGTYTLERETATD